MIDVDFGDLIDYFGSDPKTKSILMYVEGITEARKFMSAARHFARTKPIIVVKSESFPRVPKPRLLTRVRFQGRTAFTTQRSNAPVLSASTK
jgi:succinyl-CoA synthetase alpha subunit